MISNPLAFALNVSTLVLIFFAVNMLVLRSFQRQAYLPLALCLLAIAVIICQPVLAVFGPSIQPVFLILSLPALLLIAPAFWCYVQGITSETPWRVTRTLVKHFVPFGIGCVVALLALSLPEEVINGLLVQGNEQVIGSQHALIQYLIYGVLIITFVLVLGWVIQSGVYFFKIIYRLHHYRQHLKDVFASTDSREIKWLSWLLIAIGIVWLVVAVNIVLDNLFFSTQPDAIVMNAIVLVMIWSVSIWGLRQKPGFEELYDNKDNANEVSVALENTHAKYKRSALDEDMSSKLANKIEQAMREDELYLDAALSLPKLAKHIATSPNYISQTLNETIGMSFFDYVNKYRVDAAKQRLQHTRDTVLDIAMNTGFNAKSSFYTAFKKDTQLTPSQYRKQCKLTISNTATSER